MSQVDLQKHASLVKKLDGLLDVGRQMKRVSNDDLLRQFVEECESWLEFARAHTDDEELKSLKREVSSRFYERYNVRIEPKGLDNERLTATEEVIEQFEAVC